MSVLLLTVLLAAEPQPAEILSSPIRAAENIAGESQTGTLIFSKGDCLAVRIFTQSPYTHVAAIVMQEGKAIVYDSINGQGVRKLFLRDYLKSQSPDVVHVMHPHQPLTEKQCSALISHLDSQLGRPYAISHHLTGKRGAGLHCAEYMADALMNCRLIHANQPARVSPASLAEGILKFNIYSSAQTLEISSPAPVYPKGKNWCDQLWIDTKVCTSNCCRKLGRWFFCK